MKNIRLQYIIAQGILLTGLQGIQRLYKVLLGTQKLSDHQKLQKLSDHQKSLRLSDHQKLQKLQKWDGPLFI